MTGIEWILTLCGSLAVLGIGAIAGIAWNLKGSFEAFKGEVSSRMSSIETRVDDRFASMREVVELQVGHLSEKIEAFGQFENRMTAVERTATVFEEAFDGYKPWRAKVDETLAGVDKRIDGVEGRIGAIEHRASERKS